MSTAQINGTNDIASAPPKDKVTGLVKADQVLKDTNKSETLTQSAQYVKAGPI